ncbi:MAG TPA: amidase family protein, partial [Candidatus Acidoferrum sp.]
MPKSRREFLTQSSLTVIAAAAAPFVSVPETVQAQDPTQQVAGEPSAFGTAPPVGPAVDANTFAQAEKLVQVALTPSERELAAHTWASDMAPLYERRTGPRKIDLPSSLAPYSRCNPVLPGEFSGPQRNQFLPTKIDPGPLPAKDADIAFAPLTHLSAWIQSRQLTSERLTRIYLDRLQRFDPILRCVVTLTGAHAFAQAKQADAEIANGKYRGPLHGIPWGAKDLLDTA